MKHDSGADLAVVVEQRLKVLVHLQRLAHQPQVEGACRSRNGLIVLKLLSFFFISFLQSFHFS